MGISKYNSEGYHDPTTYEALSKIEKEEKAAKRAYRALVYICSPFAGDVENNVNMARVYSRFAVRNACIPFARTCSFRSSWMILSLRRGALPFLWEWCCLASVTRYGCSAGLFLQGWRQRLKKRRRKKSRSATLRKNWRRFREYEDDILHGKLPW